MLSAGLAASAKAFFYRRGVDAFGFPAASFRVRAFKVIAQSVANVYILPK